MGKWISTQDRLPQEGRYVLAKHNKTTWRDSDDQQNVNCVVAKRKEHFSLYYKGVDEELPPNCEYMHSQFVDGGKSSIDIFKVKDSGYYVWETFGASSFSDKEITHWMAIPKHTVGHEPVRGVYIF